MLKIGRESDGEHSQRYERHMRHFSHFALPPLSYHRSGPLQREHMDASATSPIRSAAVQTSLMATSGATGWSAMTKTVRDIDEDKIRDCKEDIDTLLVFVRTRAFVS